MNWLRWVVLMLALLAAGCGKDSTTKLIENLKSSDTLTRLKAVRTLPQRQAEAAQVVPALIEALDDEDDDIRRGAALGLGTFGEKAREAIPTLETKLNDEDPGVRKAARTALWYIDPQNFPDPSKRPPEPGQ
jgi:HEAT repeat protein